MPWPAGFFRRRSFCGTAPSWALTRRRSSSAEDDDSVHERTDLGVRRVLRGHHDPLVIGRPAGPFLHTPVAARRKGLAVPNGSRINDRQLAANVRSYLYHTPWSEFRITRFGWTPVKLSGSMRRADTRRVR